MSTEYKAQLDSLVAKHKCVKKASSAFVKALPTDVKERLEQLVAETKFNHRRYGNKQSYVWPLHAVFSERPIDPWPAVRYPKNVLMANFAIRTNSL